MDDLPEVVELGEQESDWVFWPAPGEFLPDRFVDLCKCGHGNLGPSWHSPDCRVVWEAWKWRAKQLHDEVWELLAEVKTLDQALTFLAARVVALGIGGEGRPEPTRTPICGNCGHLRSDHQRMSDWWGQCGHCGCSEWEEADVCVCAHVLHSHGDQGCSECGCVRWDEDL